MGRDDLDDFLLAPAPRGLEELACREVARLSVTARERLVGDSSDEILEEAVLAALGRTLAPADVQATLAELTARSVAQALQRHLPDTRGLWVCGGGAFNADLLARLAALLPQLRVQTTDALGLPPLQVEALAFAWLAREFVERRAGNRPAVTGARGPRVLGCLYPA